MKIKDTAAGYSWLSITLHWFAALAVISLYVLGDLAGDAKGDERRQLLGLHISIALSVYLVLWLRIFWRLLNARPEPVAQGKILAFLARWIPVLLLAGLAIMLISGPLTVWSGGRPLSIFGLIEFASPVGKQEALHEFLEEVHEFGANLIISALVLHVAGALKHWLIDRDRTLQRMLIPGNKTPKGG